MFVCCEMSVPPSLPEDPKDQRHLDLLSTFHYVHAGLGVLGLLFLLFHFYFMSSIFGAMEKFPEKSLEMKEFSVEATASEATETTPESGFLGESTEVGSDAEHPARELSQKQAEFAGEMFGEMQSVFVWFYVFFGGMIVGGMILNVIAGMKLKQRKGKVFTMVVAGLNCLNFPGIVLGVFTFIVLCRHSVDLMYQKRAGELG